MPLTDPHAGARLWASLRGAVSRAVVGADAPLRLMTIALLAEGHALLEDVPGVGKTLLARAFARALGLDFGRVQGTPDLLPSDVTGSSVLADGTFRFIPGPIFTNVLLVDEINRATPRTQSSLLEAMQERQVSVDGETRPLPQPFLVLATQNPIELEGTYPLPEAQLDRFMFNVVITYLSEDDEVEVVTQTTGIDRLDPERLLSGPDILEFQHIIREVLVSDEVARYAVRLVSASRPGNGVNEFVDKWVKWGAGLRASQSLILGGKARALMHGRFHVSVSDVQALAPHVLRHRVITNFYAESEGIDADAIVRRLLESVPVPASGM